MAEYRFLRAQGLKYSYAIDERGHHIPTDHPILYLEIAKFRREVRLGHGKELDFNDFYRTLCIGDKDTHDVPPSAH